MATEAVANFKMIIWTGLDSQWQREVTGEMKWLNWEIFLDKT